MTPLQVCAQREPAFGVSRDSRLPRQTAEVLSTCDPEGLWRDVLTYLCSRYDHQERLTAMEAMEHAYFHPVVSPGW